MQISLVELMQHEAAWLAYGDRRASRLPWRKRTNADLAADLDVAQLAKKIEAHDQRVWIARAAARLFTNIERQRELLVYRLGYEVIAAIRTSPAIATIVAQQPTINKIMVHTVRASRFSWFKKPLSAFMGWVKQKVGPAALVVAVPQPRVAAHEPLANAPQNIPEMALPAELNTEAALERFRQQAANNKRELVIIYRACESRFMSIQTSAEKLEHFESCFQPFKKKLRELQLYYHTDKVSNEKAKAVGLDCDTFRVEAELAFKDIQPLVEKTTNQRDGLKFFFERDLAWAAELAEIAERIRKLDESNLRFFKRVDELREIDARQNAELSSMGERIVVLSKNLDVLGEAVDIASVHAAEAERKGREADKSISDLQKRIEALMPGTMHHNQLQFAAVNACDNGVLLSPLNASPATNPNAMYSVVGAANAATLNEASLAKPHTNQVTVN